MPLQTKKISVLIVDDDPAVRTCMERLLRGEMDVECVETIAAALRACRDCQFDVIVSDIFLADGNGWDMMRKLKTMNENMRGIALTGYDDPNDAVRSIEAGFDIHVTKPVHIEILMDQIRSLADN